MTSVTIFDIKRFAVHDGPGIRTTVFMKGCPLDCWWCHNPESRKSEPEEVTFMRKLGDQEIECKKVYGQSISISQVMREILKDRVFIEESGGGVTFSGGEPLYQCEAIYELLKSCSTEGLHTTIDTCGYAQWNIFEKILPYTDLFLYDLKLMDPVRHKRFTGVKNDLILQNLQKLLAAHAEVELRIPVIPGANDGRRELEMYLGYLAGISDKISRIHLLPYHEIAKNKYKKLNLKNRMQTLHKKTGLEIQVLKNAIDNLGFAVEIGD